MYRTIDAAFWTDPKVRALKVSEKFLFLYLITNPHTHVSGIYILPAEVMSIETGCPKKTLDTLCDTLSSTGFCSFDRPRAVVWVRNMFGYQGAGEKNQRSAAHHLAEDLHKSPLIIEFCTRYPSVRQYLPEGFLDRVSISYSTLPTPDSRSLIPDSLILKPDSARKTRAPETLPVTDEMRQWARESGITVELDAETVAMLDWHRGKGNLHLDWVATWRTWMRNTKKFGGSNGKNGNHRTAVPFGGAPEYKPRQ